MRITGLLLAAILSISTASAATPQPGAVDLAPAPEVAAAAIPSDPHAERQRLLQALRDNDVAALISANGDEAGLRRFLTDGADQREEILARIAKGSWNETDANLLRWWTTLAGPDGVKRASAELYPLWQQHLARSLAGFQGGLLMLGQSAAQSQKLNQVERAQLLELQFALTAWLARTDLGDRALFERVLGHAREWILASGKAHPLELALTTPQQRLELGARAMRSAKAIATLYGLDLENTLRGARIEKLGGMPDEMTLRWSFSLLGVPIVVDEELALWEGEWREAGQVRMLRAEAAPEADPALPGDADSEAEEGR